MKYILGLQLVLLCSFSYSQTNRINKIVVDKNSKIPLENVLIFNEIDNSTTNSDGEFMFVSQKNEINLNLLGYTAIKTSFDALKTTRDTIFMESKAIVLEEVVVSNAAAFVNKFYNNSINNYLTQYSVNFFLRSVLKKDKEIIVLQDINGAENHNESQKDIISLELLNMRKTYIYDKKDKVQFLFPNFQGLLGIIWPTLDNCSFTETTFKDDNFKKILFESKKKNPDGQIFKGHMIISKIDYAMVEYSFEGVSNVEIIPYQKHGITRSAKSRTIKYNKILQFRKDDTSNKYFCSIAKMDSTVEIYLDKKTENPVYFDNELHFFTINKPKNIAIESNFSVNIDVLKAKFPYSKDFWDNQNQLPLTQELELFLKSVAEKKNKNKEYEIIGNF